ncbi:hypothetical protein ABFY60_11170 [Lysinibacillus pakistanensis]|uniref:hypothetical protein n=1 Tax=Lysinibacillus pakistanensis TaxID=759811 RepID=UPI003D2C6CCC
MDIYSELKKVTWKKEQYFLWKHDLYVLKEKPNESDFLKQIESKSLAYMKKWEKSEEYLNLVSVLIQSKIAEDLEKIYYSLRDKAHQGDEKAIKMLLELQKSSKEYQKSTSKSVGKEDRAEPSPLDELELE